MAQPSVRLKLPRTDACRRIPVQLMRPLRTRLSYLPSSHRHASTTPKPRVLEKPSKFNPPSHPQKLSKTGPRQYPGPPLSASEIATQKTRQYPHMMPPEGSFMRWFLTNRSIHTWITLSTLFFLAFYTMIQNFLRTSPFAHLLPSANTFLSHPVDWIAQYIEVYKLHTIRISEETAERRRKKVEDVKKRSLYRKAHGLEKEQGLGRWMAKSDNELLKAASNIDGAVGSEVDDASPIRRDAPKTDGASEAVYTDWEGNRKPIKKWLGIW